MSKAVVTASVEFIEKLTEPGKMSKAHALETIEDIIEELMSRSECLREEIANED